jgi:hypothetical protein
VDDTQLIGSAFPNADGSGLGSGAEFAESLEQTGNYGTWKPDLPLAIIGIADQKVHSIFQFYEFVHSLEGSVRSRSLDGGNPRKIRHPFLPLGWGLYRTAAGLREIASRC